MITCDAIQDGKVCGREATVSHAVTISVTFGVTEAPLAVCIPLAVMAHDLCESCAQPIIELVEGKS
ncbi:MAG: hypothetical protein WC565_03060 [Parcubacteria group bacterium]